MQALRAGELDRNIQITADPFLKWPGGKRWLRNEILQLCPINYRTYIEPFLGGGSVFFTISPNLAVLSDLNEDLINTYKSIRDNPDKIEELLRNHQQNHSAKYYYEVRASSPRRRMDRAARFIYLNRTCFNGIYRVNKKGEFNVPCGTKTSVCLPSDDWNSVAHCLNRASIETADFQVAIDQAEEGDFIYADPPYTVNHNYNGFLKYNEVMFSWADQLRLRAALSRAASRGVRFILSNAYHESVRELYRDLGQSMVLTRNSKISGKISGRKPTEELLVFQL